MKIRTKLTLRFMLTGAIIMIFCFIVIYILAGNFRKAMAEKRMENRSQTYARLLFDVKVIDKATLTLIDKYTSKILIDEQIVIYDDEFKPVFSNCPPDSVDLTSGTVAKIRTNKKVFIKEGDRECLAFLYKNNGHIYYVVSTAFDEYGLNWMFGLEKFLCISFVISLVLLFIAGYYYSGRALSPISKIVRQVEQINVTRLGQRLIAGNSKDEIAHLADTFNNMLQRIEDAVEMQRNFVSNAAHELRTPLTKLTSELEVTLMKHRSTDEYITALHSLLEEIKTLNILSSGLLDLAYSSASTLTIKVTDIRIDELLFNARTDLIIKNEKYHIIIEFAQLPDEEHNLMIKGNASLLKSAFINLMDNACKFSSDQKVIVIIETVIKKIIIKIKDNGIGIPFLELTKIWEPFYRAENARSRKGHGMGLPLVKKIIELHKGTIQINSTLNLGTEVIVTLPI